jgi:parvulin-like peptidyl-prolyl isomerase
MAKRNKNVPVEPKAETRKQTRLRARDQERNRRLMMIVGGAVALALVLVLAGVISQMVIKPRSVLAQVENRTIITRDFWGRTLLRKSELENQLRQLQLLSQQFGAQGQNFFGSQMAQIQATLSSPLSLGTQVVNLMIEEEVIRIRAEEMGVTVPDAEVEEVLREEIARGQGAVTVPQATATAEALAAITPTPLPTPAEADESEAVETEAKETDAEVAEAEAPEELPTPTPLPVLDDALYQEGLNALSDRLRRVGLSVEDYREIIRTRLLRERLEEVIGAERVDETEEQINVRHILIRVDETAAPAEEPAEGEEANEQLDDAQALAFIEELRERILAGEDFAELAREYSDDPGSGAQGGDLGWVGGGAFVPEFEETAFALPVGEISEPVRTTFGYHLIQVVDRDENRPKDEGQVQQERARTFQEWLQEQTLMLNIQRPTDLPSRLPSGL